MLEHSFLRLLDYSFPATFIPMMELSFSGPFVPWNIRSLELSFPGPFVPGNFRSQERTNPADLSLRGPFVHLSADILLPFVSNIGLVFLLLGTSFRHSTSFIFH